MDGPTYLTVDPYVVAAAGRDTAATADAWRTWADRIRTSFIHAGEAVVAPRLEQALIQYALTRQPRFIQISAQVAALGDSVVAAAGTVAGADDEAARSLRRQTDRLPPRPTGTGVLRRPVNAPVGSVASPA